MTFKRFSSDPTHSKKLPANDAAKPGETNGQQAAAATKAPDAGKPTTKA